MLARLLITLAMLLLQGMSPARGQLMDAPQADPAAAEERDLYGRSTPQGLATKLVETLAAQDYERAVVYLDIEDEESPFGQARAERLAVQLETLLDAGGTITPQLQLSTSALGKLDDGLDPGLEQIGVLRAGGDVLPLLAARVEGKDGKPIWKVARRTLVRVPHLVDESEARMVDEFLPERLVAKRVFGAPVGHWLVLIACLFAALLMTRGTWRIVTLLVARSLAGRERRKKTKLLLAVTNPLSLFLATWVYRALSQPLGLSIVARASIDEFAELIALFSLAWLFWRVADAVTTLGTDEMVRRGSIRAVSATVFLRRTVKAIVASIAIVAVLASLGMNVSAGLAALGVGGLALALGAQKSIENLVGGLTIIADQPVKVGDFCKIGGHLGTIEDIGLRSTRLRTLARTVVTIPNGELATVDIENYAARDLYWFNPVLALRYETSPDQIRYLLVEVRSLLYAHPKVSPEPARVRFETLGSDCLELRVFAYVRASSYDDFLEVQEDLLLRIMDTVETSGSSFAFPSQTVYLARDGGLDKERASAAEETVEGWRASDELQIPRFSDQRRTELKGALSYPPDGSVLNRAPEEGRSDFARTERRRGTFWRKSVQ